MKYLVMLLFLLTCSIASATIYMQKDEYGNVTYSDTPLSNGEIVSIPEGNTTSSTNAPPTSEITPPPTPGAVGSTQTPLAESIAVETVQKKPYTIFEMISPKDQETIQNQPVIPVEIRIVPELQAGDRILLLVDNKPWGAPEASTHLELGQIDRGTHQVSAVVLDETQKILKQSNTATIYVHRVTLNSPSRPQP